MVTPLESMITVGAYGRSRTVLNRIGTVDETGMRQAGLAAMIGGTIFGANILSYTIFGFEGILADNVLRTSLNDAVLFVAWGLMLWGLLGVRSYGMGREYGRLWSAGIVTMGIGLALCTVGFFVEALAPLAGLMTLYEIGGMTIGIGVLTFVPLGAVVLGTALFRTGAVSRLGAILMIAAGPSMLAAMFVGEMLPPLVGAALFGAVLGAAWIVVGFELRTRPAETATEAVAA
ncbi:MAG: hypothetical protein IH933_02620 [Euryarchaeota archaeon]|jgi:hypothetical protein|nr:hypothetical protein [Euryarchaeota archaeon]